MGTDMTLNKLLSVEYDYDYSTDGGAQGAIDLSAATRNLQGTLPDGFVTTHCYVSVKTDVTSAGAATITIGTTDDPNGFLASTGKADLTQYDVVGGAVATLQPVANDADSSDVVVTVGTADLTAGAFKVTLYGFIPSDKAGL